MILKDFTVEKIFSVLIGSEYEWVVDLKNFSIHFNHSEPDILNISCTTFVSNPLLHTLLLDEEDPSKNTCPDELKQLISSTLLNFSDKNGSGENPIDLTEHLNFSPSLTHNGCQPKHEKSVKENFCTVKTTLKTSNCSNPEELKVDNNEINLTRSSLFNYFKLNYTVEAKFAGENGCDVRITSMKTLETKRFYIKNETTDNYACIREKYELVTEKEAAERRADVVRETDEAKTEEDRETAISDKEKVSLPNISYRKVSKTNIFQQKKVQWKSDPANEWFEMYSLINSIYSANIVYGTLSEWVFS